MGKGKKVFLSGDFNIDLLKHEDHNDSKKFLDLLYSVGLYPLINKPTIITISSETLIDNFFTNKLESKLKNGLLINDISDHFLVFTICHYKEKLTRCKRPQYILKRQLNDESINAFKTELGNNSWDTVLNSSNVNVAHNNFIDIFTQLYNKHCPVKKNNI